LTGSTITQNRVGEKPTVLGGVKFSTSSQKPKKVGWCQTPHAYFLEWGRYLPALEVSLLGIILDRTIGCSKQRAAIRISTFMEYTGKSERAIQFSLSRLADKPVSDDKDEKYGLVQISGRKGGRGVVPTFAVDLEAVQAYILAVKRVQFSVSKRVQFSREKRVQFPAPGIKDSLQIKDSPLPKDSSSSVLKKEQCGFVIEQAQTAPIVDRGLEPRKPEFLFSQKNDDDENPKPAGSSTPDSLWEIGTLAENPRNPSLEKPNPKLDTWAQVRQLAPEISLADEQWLKEQMELKGITPAALLELAKQNPPANFKLGPVAALKYLVNQFVRKSKSALLHHATAEALGIGQPHQAIVETPKCAKCEWGYLPDRSHCDCELGRELRRVDERAKRAPPSSETLAAKVQTG
jgi:hypothetical protein